MTVLLSVRAGGTTPGFAKSTLISESSATPSQQGFCKEQTLGAHAIQNCLPILAPSNAHEHHSNRCGPDVIPLISDSVPSHVDFGRTPHCS